MSIEVFFNVECTHFGGPLGVIISYIPLSDLLTGDIASSCKFLHEYSYRYTSDPNTVLLKNREQVVHFFQNNEFMLKKPNDSLFLCFLNPKRMERIYNLLSDDWVDFTLLLLIFCFKIGLPKSFLRLVDLVGNDSEKDKTHNLANLFDSVLRIMCSFRREFTYTDYVCIERTNFHFEQICDRNRYFSTGSYMSSGSYFSYIDTTITTTEESEENPFGFQTHLVIPLIRKSTETLLLSQYLRLSHGFGGVTSQHYFHSILEKLDFRLFLLLMNIIKSSMDGYSYFPRYQVYDFIKDHFITLQEKANERQEQVIFDILTHPNGLNNLLRSRISGNKDPQLLKTLFENEMFWNRTKNHISYSFGHSRRRLRKPNRHNDLLQIVTHIPSLSYPLYRSFLEIENNDQFLSVFSSRFPSQVERFRKTKEISRIKYGKDSLKNNPMLFLDGSNHKNVGFLGDPKICDFLYRQFDGIRDLHRCGFQFDEKSLPQMYVLCFNCQDIKSFGTMIGHLKKKRRSSNDSYLLVGVIDLSYDGSKRIMSKKIGFRLAKELKIDYVEIFLPLGTRQELDKNVTIAAFSYLCSSLDRFVGSLI